MKVLVGILMAVRVPLAVLFSISLVYAHVHDGSLSQYAQNFLNQQQIPGQPGSSCCSQADAAMVEEDIRYGADGIGRYWVRCPLDSDCPLKEWTIVPTEVVITKPNKIGRPVVWWYGVSYNNDQTVAKPPGVRCYMPGSGI